MCTLDSIGYEIRLFRMLYGLSCGVVRVGSLWIGLGAAVFWCENVLAAIVIVALNEPTIEHTILRCRTMTYNDEQCRVT